ncbi:glycerate kinase [Ixodes scapularis]|uniref:glycerate kinase n=1 Tax=Ixodes scapularis TaxID=6945 RepID=UPI001A9FEB82|nr:glycerate kinase [Ixodes scapularis]
MASAAASSSLGVLRQQARAMLEAGIQAVLPGALVAKAMRREGNTLYLGSQQVLPLAHNVYLVGFGKAVGGMAHVAQQLLGDHLIRGVVSLPVGTRHTAELLHKPEMVPRDPVQVYEGAQNNLPDDAAMAAATAIVTLVSRLQATDLLLVLISGGGSALLPLPLEPLTLKEKVATIQLLSQGGAKVQEINSVRKRLSVVKGGNLLRHTRARVVSLILSDVVDDPLEAIASGPTVPNLEDEGLALRIIDKYGLRTKVAPNVVMLLERHLHQDMNQPQTAKAFNLLIGNNKVAARAVCATARQLGYQAHLLTTSLQGEAREVGKAFALLASYLCHEEPPEGRHFSISEVTPVLQVRYRDLAQLKESASLSFSRGRPVCVVAAGETTVHVRGSGLGGRSQEMALSAALVLDALFPTPGEALGDPLFLAAGTDGADGPTDAAGAVAHPGTVREARAQGLDPAAALENNDSHGFFRAYAGGADHVVTGPTGTNVMDLDLLLLWPRFIGGARQAPADQA